MSETTKRDGGGQAAETTPDCSSCELYSLDRARTGEQLQIMEVGDEHARMQALRFGMAEGACVTCVTRIPAGPLVLKSGRQEIAIGRALAKRIQVRRHVPGAPVVHQG